MEIILHIRASTYQNSGRYDSSVPNMNLHHFHTAADRAPVNVIPQNTVILAS